MSGEKSSGALVGFEYSGIFVQSGQQYGMSIPAFTPITGTFTYDTTSSPTHAVAGCTDCNGYQQQRTGGFTANLLSHEIQVNDYVVEVLNGHTQPDGSVADVLSVNFSTFYNPTLAPMLVNNTPRPVGLFFIGLIGPTDWFSSSSLPASLDAGKLDRASGLLFDFGTNGQLPFIVSSISAIEGDPQSVPEPSVGLLLGILGMLMLTCKFRVGRRAQC